MRHTFPPTHTLREITALPVYLSWNANSYSSVPCSKVALYRVSATIKSIPITQSWKLLTGQQGDIDAVSGIQDQLFVKVAVCYAMCRFLCNQTREL